MDTNMWVAVAAGLILAYLVLYALVRSGRRVLGLVLHGILGVAGLFLCSRWGGPVAGNALTVLIASLLGIPGVVLMIALGSIL